MVCRFCAADRERRGLLPKMMAFSRDQAKALTGLTDSQLRYWDKTDFFSPQYVDRSMSGPYRMAYSFRDIVGLRAIAQMRQHVPLQQLRRVGEYLGRYQDPWASLTFYIAGRRVYFDEPETGALVQPPGQTAMRIEMEKVAREVDRAVERLRKRGPEQIGKIARHRHVVHNTPVLEGTRIPTASVWDFHEAGYTRAAINQQYPTLTLDDIDAAIQYEESRRAQNRQAG
jgi:uncharacterized protein (DUF433 family)